MSKFRLSVMNNGGVRLEMYDPSNPDDVAVLYSGGDPIQNLADPKADIQANKMDDVEKKIIRSGAYSGKIHKPIKAEDLTKNGVKGTFSADKFEDLLAAIEADTKLNTPDSEGDTPRDAIERQLFNIWGIVDPSKTRKLVDDKSLQVNLNAAGADNISGHSTILSGMAATFNDYYKNRVASRSELTETDHKVTFTRVELGDGAPCADGLLVKYKFRGMDVYSIVGVDKDGKTTGLIEHNGNKMFDKRTLDDSELISNELGVINIATPGSAFTDGKPTKSPEFGIAFRDSFRTNFCIAGSNQSLKPKLDEAFASNAKSTSGGYDGVKFENAEEVWVHKVDSDHVYLSIVDPADAGKRKYYLMEKSGNKFTGYKDADLDEIKNSKALKHENDIQKDKLLDNGNWGEKKTLKSYIAGMGEETGLVFIKAVNHPATSVGTPPAVLTFNEDNAISIPGHWDELFVEKYMLDKNLPVLYRPGSKSEEKPRSSSTPSTDDGKSAAEIAELRKTIKEQNEQLKGVTGLVTNWMEKAGMDHESATQAGATASGALQTGKSFGNSLTNILMGKGGLIGAAVLGGIFGMGQMNAAGQGDKGMLGLLLGAVIAGGLAMAVQKGYKQSVTDGQDTHRQAVMMQRELDQINTAGNPGRA